ncbi:hypothetical protein [[Ruminococcus] torques]|uniref:hypothetical protein n=2 Tax=[Ruminococcus] torques TaxID=33039 RepID=UPI003AB5E7AC
MELVTGRSGKPHITSQQVRQLQQGIFGENACILNTGSMLTPEVQSSNKIRIKDGALMFQGALFTVKVGVYDEVTINNGNQGMKRKDVIAVKYTYDSSRNIESGEWAVVQGTPAASNPAVPSMPVTDGDIQAGDAEVYCPVFVINLDGINVTGVDIIPPMMDDMSTINKYLSELSSDFTKIKNYIVEEGSNSNGKYRKWSDGTLEMWFNSPFTCAIGTKAGSIYTSGQFTLNFPVASKTKCNIVLTIGAGGAIWGKVYGSANGYKSSFSYHLLSAVTWNVASFDLSYYARGTWK